MQGYTALNQTILIFENEDAVRETVASTLKRSGFSVATATDSVQADHTLERIFPCMILLGRMSPGSSALAFAKRLRSRETTSEIPIVMLTTNQDEGDTTPSFEAEVADFVAKPSCGRELVMRVKAALARARSIAHENILEIDVLRLDPLGQRVTAQGEPVELGRLEFRLLYFFMRHPERTFTRSQLLDGVWGRHVYAEIRTVDVHIYQLRKALSRHGIGELIQTVRGIGYRLSGCMF